MCIRDRRNVPSELFQLSCHTLTNKHCNNKEWLSLPYERTRKDVYKRKFQKDGDRLKEDSIFTYGKLEYVPSFNDS